MSFLSPDLKSLVRDGYKIAVVCGANSETKKGKLYAIDFDPDYLEKAGIPLSRARDFEWLRKANTLTRIGPREGSFTQFVRVRNGEDIPDEYFIRGCERVQGAMQYSIIPPGHGWWLDGGKQRIADWEEVKEAYGEMGLIKPGWNPNFKKKHSVRRQKKEKGLRVGTQWLPDPAKGKGWWLSIKYNVIPATVAPKEHGESAPRTLMRRIITFAHEKGISFRDIPPMVTMADDMHLNRLQRSWVKDRLEYEYR